ncbi:hypothetical protein N7481_012570 [Penicillium waksmanii]|uniref:uncharacterized protein n=1 Tax=Penicillium waksmanii TaxID=69791 RepID=UPI0025474BDC|nr:uncharacterized protein N7481_012570 [Penicillium waksmanii]KAJ5965856.1 hypothetical protein N7481_012570 [Penicillium waksmanii]
MHPLSIRYQELEGERPLFLQTIECPFTVETWRTLLKKTARFLVFEPGEQWMYSPGLEWAGLINKNQVEQVTGLKLGKYIETVFTVLIRTPQLLLVGRHEKRHCWCVLVPASPHWRPKGCRLAESKRAVYTILE